MSSPNGHANGPVAINHLDKSAPPAMASAPGLFNPDQVKQFVALLEVPFDPAVDGAIGVPCGGYCGERECRDSRR